MQTNQLLGKGVHDFLCRTNLENSTLEELTGLKTCCI